MQFPIIGSAVGNLVRGRPPTDAEEANKSEAEIATHTIVDCTVLGIPGEYGCGVSKREVVMTA